MCTAPSFKRRISNQLHKTIELQSSPSMYITQSYTPVPYNPLLAPIVILYVNSLFLNYCQLSALLVCFTFFITELNHEIIHDPTKGSHIGHMPWGLYHLQDLGSLHHAPFLPRQFLLICPVQHFLVMLHAVTIYMGSVSRNAHLCLNRSTLIAVW